VHLITVTPPFPTVVAPDSTSASVVDVADTVTSFLSHVENVHGRVFVHCLAGVSRSASVVLLHLLLRHRMPLQDAFRYLRSCRPHICPNNAFKLQLARLELQELGYSSVAKDGDRTWDFYEWNSIKRSMPTARPDEDEDQRRGGADKHGSFLRQLSVSSAQDMQGCCVVS
jgi:hypothetical protein